MRWSGKTSGFMKCASLIQAVNADNPDPAVIGEAVRVIRSGGVVVFPTTSLYGLAADAHNPRAVDKVRAIKGRPEGKPILLLIKNQAAVAPLAKRVTPVAERLMSAFWPGDLTLVMDAGNDCPAEFISKIGKIGLRVPAHPVAVSLVNQLSGPVTGTSANISGHPSVWRSEQLTTAFGDTNPDLILDAGALKGGAGSTVVDVTVSPPVILREGSIPADKIFAAIADL